MLRIGVRSAALFVMLAWMSGCAAEPDGPPSVAGKPAEEQAEIVVDVACEYTARCGIVLLTCADCDADDCGGCTAEHVPVTYEACIEEIGSEYEQDFACEPLTDAQTQAVDACLAALVDRPCSDAAAVEAWANGELDGERPDALPPVCDVEDEIGESCDDEWPGGDDGLEPDPG